MGRDPCRFCRCRLGDGLLKSGERSFDDSGERAPFGVGFLGFGDQEGCGGRFALNKGTRAELFGYAVEPTSQAPARDRR
jgi:hypothetical protein